MLYKIHFSDLQCWLPTTARNQSKTLGKTSLQKEIFVNSGRRAVHFCVWLRVGGRGYDNKIAATLFFYNWRPTCIRSKMRRLKRQQTGAPSGTLYYHTSLLYSYSSFIVGGTCRTMSLNRFHLWKKQQVRNPWYALNGTSDNCALLGLKSFLALRL